jgi:hypothetical protein
MRRQREEIDSDTDRRYLMAALARVRIALEHATLRRSQDAGEKAPQPLPSLLREQEEPTTLEHLCENFGLSAFERDTLLLAVGIELDESFAPLCAAAGGEVRRPFPTFGLALAVLPDAHWCAFTPSAALRHWRLIEILSGDTLMTNRFRIDERLLHHLLGASELDERLQSLVEPVGALRTLPFSYRVHGERVIKQLQADQADSGQWTVVQLCGEASKGKRALAAAVCGELGLRLHALNASDIPAASAERDTLARLWEREAVLLGSALLICLDGAEQREGARALAERVQGLVLVCTREVIALPSRRSLALDIDRPSVPERRALWKHALGPLAESFNGQLETVAAQFPLDVSDIERVGRSVRALAGDDVESEDGNGKPAVGSLLWEACRSETRRPLDACAQRIETRACWDDIVLPDGQASSLREISVHVRQQARVYDKRVSMIHGASPHGAFAAWASRRCSRGRAEPGRRSPPKLLRTNCRSISIALT